MPYNRNFTLIPPGSRPRRAKKPILLTATLILFLLSCSNTYGKALCLEPELLSPINGQCLSSHKSTVCPYQASSQLSTKSIIISHSATQKEIGDMILEFRKGGIEVGNKVSIKRRLNWVKHVRLHFSHPLGLNYKMKVTGFQKLVFNLVYNEKNQLLYFTYRINDEEVYSKIRLNTKGFKNYVCFDTGVVVTGDTSEDIIRY